MSSITNINNTDFSNIKPAYLNYNINNNISNNDYNNEDLLNDQNYNIEDLKKLEIDSEIELIYDITYQTYKNEFLNNKSFSVESNDQISDDCDFIINEIENRMKKRNDNLTDSLLSEFLEDIGNKNK